MLAVSYENYKGGVNNLCVAEYFKDCYTVAIATSEKGRPVALKNLRRKLRKLGLFDVVKNCY
jgi:hypothetical protein